MNKTINAIAKCPYFLGDTRQKIICEGMLSRTRCMLHFEGEPDKLRHEAHFCSGVWDKCPMALSVTAHKYPYYEM